MMEGDPSKASQIIVYKNGIWRAGCGFDHVESGTVDTGSYISANGDGWPLPFFTTKPIPLKIYDNRRYYPYIVFTYVDDGGASNHSRQMAFSSGVNSGYNSESQIVEDGPVNINHATIYAGIQADGYYKAVTTNYYLKVPGRKIKRYMDCLPGIFLGLYYATTYISEMGVMID